MNQPWIYMCSPSHPSGSSQCTSPEHLERLVFKGSLWWFFVKQINLCNSNVSIIMILFCKFLFYYITFACSKVQLALHNNENSHWIYIYHFGAFSGSSVGKESTYNAGNPGLIPGLGRSAGEGIGYPLQYSWASLVAQLVKNPPAMQETWVQSLLD